MAQATAPRTSLSDKDAIAQLLAATGGAKTPEALFAVLGGGPLSATVQLTAAQSRNLFTTPQVIVPAPGAGKLIVLLGGAICYTFGTSAASASDAYYQFTYQGAVGIDLGLAGKLLTLTEDSVALIALGDFAAAVVPEVDSVNKALVMAFASSNATGGDGTLEVTVLYSVIEM